LAEISKVGEGGWLPSRSLVVKGAKRKGQTNLGKRAGAGGESGAAVLAREKRAFSRLTEIITKTSLFYEGEVRGKKEGINSRTEKKKGPKPNCGG